MFTDIFGIIRGIVSGVTDTASNITGNNAAGNSQRASTSKSIIEMLSGHRVGLDANLAKQAKRNIGQFPMIISNAIGDEQALKVCEIVERTIADMILLCIQNGNDLIDLRDPEAKRRFIESYTNGGNTSLDYDTLSHGYKSFASDYRTNCISGIDAITLKKVANEAMYLNDMAITSSFEMTTLFNPCLSVEDEFEMGAVAPISAPMGAATAPKDDEEDEALASEAMNFGRKPNPNSKPSSTGSSSSGSGSSGSSSKPSSSGSSGSGSSSGSSGSGSSSGGSGSSGSGSSSSGTRSRTTSSAFTNKAYPKNLRNPLNGGRLTRPILDGTKSSKIEEKVSKLSPTIVNATVFLQTPTDAIEKNLAFGVKVNAHEVSSDELVKAIKETYSSTSLITRLIRWRSGELSFFKDVLLNLKEIKQTVAARNNRNTKNGLSGIFASMRFNNKNAIAMKTLSANGGLLPTVSIMINLDEVDQIKNTCGKDLLKNIKDARELCNKLGLFSIQIVDSANDSFYSYFNDDASMYKKTSLKNDKNKNSDDVVKAIFGALKR